MLNTPMVRLRPFPAAHPLEGPNTMSGPDTETLISLWGHELRTGREGVRVTLLSSITHAPLAPRSARGNVKCLKVDCHQRVCPATLVPPAIRIHVAELCPCGIHSHRRHNVVRPPLPRVRPPSDVRLCLQDNTRFRTRRQRQLGRPHVCLKRVLDQRTVGSTRPSPRDGEPQLLSQRGVPDQECKHHNNKQSARESARHHVGEKYVLFF